MNGIRSLNAGAYANLPQQDIRLSGDHRPTYTQRRRTQMAGGGIMGSNAGSMLVAPTADGSRPGYWGISDAWDWAKEKAVPFIADKAMDLGGDWIKDKLGMGDPQPMPQGSPGQINPYTPPYFPTGMPQGSPGQINPYTPPYFPESTVAGPMDYLKDQAINKAIPYLTKNASNILSNDLGVPDDEYYEAQYDLSTPRGGGGDRDFEMPDQKQTPDSGGFDWRKGLATILPGGDPGYVKGGLYNQLLGRVDAQGNPIDPEKGDTSIARQIANIGVPLAAGKFAHDYQRDWLAKQPKFPMDETGIKFQTARQYMDDPKQRFKPKEIYADTAAMAAEGGRIGYQSGGNGNRYSYLIDKVNKGIPLTPPEAKELQMLEITYADVDRDPSAQGGRIGYQDAGDVEIPKPDTENILKNLEDFLKKRKDYEDRIMRAPKQSAAEGGLMNLGGMEKDYRQEGGFVPLGGEEKADDVPARLSKNEFVFTADAVRAAGGGDIDQGAEVMENLMENLEAGGKVSEDSQGLEGAQDMFANAQQLEKRII